MDIDDEIAEYFTAVTLAHDVKKIIEGNDVDNKREFQISLKPYKIVKLEDTIKAKTYIAQQKKQIQSLEKEIPSLEQKIQSLEKEIERLRAIMNSCDRCQWESEPMKLKM